MSSSSAAPLSSDYHYFPESGPPSIATTTSSTPPPSSSTTNIHTTPSHQQDGLGAAPQQGGDGIVVKKSDSTTPTTTATTIHKDAMYFMVEVVEHQRRMPLFGWSGDRLLPTDRFNFSNQKGTLERKREDVDRELPTHQRCSWVTEWELYCGTDEVDHYHHIGLDENRHHAKKYCRFDEDGNWEYALDFPRDYVHEYQKLYHWVRRRFWRRIFLINAPLSYQVDFPANFKAVMHTECVNMKKLDLAKQEYINERHVGQ